MERKNRKSPEKKPKEYWQQKGWRKKLVDEYTVYNGHFTVGSEGNRQSFVGSVYERSLLGKKLIHVFVQSHRPRIFRNLPFTLIDTKRLIFEADFEQPPTSVNEAIMQTEQLLNEHLLELL